MTGMALAYRFCISGDKIDFFLTHSILEESMMDPEKEEVQETNISSPAIM